MDACPDDETLGAHAERRLTPSETEAIESHLASCVSCRGTAVLFARLRTPEPMDRRWWLAAAAGLLAVLLPRWDRPIRPAVPPPPVPAASLSSPFPSVEGTFILGHATSVSLKPGSRAEVRQGSLSLLEGSAWVEDPGEPCEIRVPGGTVTAAEARFLVEILPPRKAASWIRDAWASDPSEVRVWVETGSAVLRQGSAEGVQVSAGTEGRLGPTGFQEPSPSAPPPWRGETGWRSLRPVPVHLKDARLALDCGEGPCVWEALLRRRDPAASIGVRFAAGGRCWEIPLGAALLEAPDRLRVRVEIRSGWVRIRSGGCEVLQGPVRDLDRRLEPVQGKPGLRAWGGDVEIVEARWRTGS